MNREFETGQFPKPSNKLSKIEDIFNSVTNAEDLDIHTLWNIMYEINLPCKSNPHYKFIIYLYEIGCPELECKCQDYDENHFGKVVSYEGEWYADLDFRILGDRHWKLRREWINSDYTLPIEHKEIVYPYLWKLTPCPLWSQNQSYRKHEQSI